MGLRTKKENNRYFIKGKIDSLTTNNNDQIFFSLKPTKDYRYSDESVIGKNEEIWFAYVNGEVRNVEKRALKGIVVEKNLADVVKHSFSNQILVTVGLEQCNNGQGFRLMELRLK